MKNIEPGTLLVVEPPFASIDNRLYDEKRCHSINFLQPKEKNSPVEYYNDDIFRLLNEVEKQLLIGNTIGLTFDKIKLMQPIRRWLVEKKDENLSQQDNNDITDLADCDEMSATIRKQWQQPFSK